MEAIQKENLAKYKGGRREAYQCQKQNRFILTRWDISQIKKDSGLLILVRLVHISHSLALSHYCHLWTL